MSHLRCSAGEPTDAKCHRRLQPADFQQSRTRVASSTTNATSVLGGAACMHAPTLPNQLLLQRLLQALHPRYSRTPCLQDTQQQCWSNTMPACAAACSDPVFDKPASHTGSCWRLACAALQLAPSEPHTAARHSPAQLAYKPAAPSCKSEFINTTAAHMCTAPDLNMMQCCCSRMIMLALRSTASRWHAGQQPRRHCGAQHLRQQTLLCPAHNSPMWRHPQPAWSILAPTLATTKHSSWHQSTIAMLSSPLCLSTCRS